MGTDIALAYEGRNVADLGRLHNFYYDMTMSFEKNMNNLDKVEVDAVKDFLIYFNKAKASEQRDILEDFADTMKKIGATRTLIRSIDDDSKLYAYISW